jgi:hypothetical protein
MEGKILFIPIFHRDKKIGMTAGTMLPKKPNHSLQILFIMELFNTLLLFPI